MISIVNIPDPYTTSIAVAMYYPMPIRYDNTLCVLKEKEEKKPQKRVQPSGNIGKFLDTYV